MRRDESLVKDDTDRRWRWLQPEVVLLIGLVVAVYFTMTTALPVRGEESRWARVATEMLETGDWIVPRQQGLPFLDRPPLGPWLMALVGKIHGRVDLVAIRLPSALAILATTLLVYGYSRRSLSRLGAFTAGATYISFGLVQQIGWTGENEAVYTLLFSAALLLWHRGYIRSWPPAVTWSVGYGLAALATLVKGPQALVYFVAVTVVYLLTQRKWRRLVSLSHLAGIAVFLLVVGLWLVPFYLRMGRQSAIDILTQTSVIRYGTDGLLAHMALYPLEIWVSLLPGSVVLVGLIYPRVLRQLGSAPAELRFALTALAVTFPSVWLAQQAQPRYFMPLFPCAAVLVGWAVARLVDARPASAAQRWWQLCLVGAATGIAGFGAVLLAAPYTSSKHLQTVAPPPPQVFLYVVAFLAIAGILVWAAVRVHARSTWVVVASIAIFQALLFRGLLTSAWSRTANDMTDVVARLRRSLPADVQLVSFARAQHRFAYYYRTPIPMLPWPQCAAEVPTDVTYFCFDPQAPNVPSGGALPFEWEQIARLNTDSSERDVPEAFTVVGRIIR